jgi:hypothetical protein
MKLNPEIFIRRDFVLTWLIIIKHSKGVSQHKAKEKTWPRSS